MISQIDVISAPRCPESPITMRRQDTTPLRCSYVTAVTSEQKIQLEIATPADIPSWVSRSGSTSVCGIWWIDPLESQPPAQPIALSEALTRPDASKAWVFNQNRLAAKNGVRAARLNRPEGFAHMAGNDDLRFEEVARMGPRRGGEPPIHPVRARGRHQLLRYRRYVFTGS